jgi:hypothetical protein
MQAIRATSIAVTTICALALAMAPVRTQRDPRNDDRAAAARAHGAPSVVIATTPLSVDVDSDTPIADLALETLADGMVVLSGTVPPSPMPVTGARPSLFVVADSDRHTYRTFRVRGAVEGPLIASNIIDYSYSRCDYS